LTAFPFLAADFNYRTGEVEKLKLETRKSKLEIRKTREGTVGPCRSSVSVFTI